MVSIAGPSTTGVETVLEQQRLELEGLKLPAEEREKRIALQQQVNTAVLTGKGWDNVPPQVRKEADTPWFQSLLTFDPTKVLDDVRQPLLFVHGALDRQVPVEHVERLSDIARKESKSKSVEVVVVRGVNHLLVAGDHRRDQRVRHASGSQRQQGRHNGDDRLADEDVRSDSMKPAQS